MKNKEPIATEYLFGLPRSCFEPELTVLANMRIDAANELIAKLVLERDKTEPGEEMKALQERYAKVTKARDFWISISLEK